MNNNERENLIKELRRQAFEFSYDNEVTPEQRRVLIKYIKLTLEDAKKLPREQLHGDRGQAIAHDINGIIAVQDWLGDAEGYIKTSEPTFSKLFNHSMPLELEQQDNGYDLQTLEREWQALFVAGDKLR